MFRPRNMNKQNGLAVGRMDADGLVMGLVNDGRWAVTSEPVPVIAHYLFGILCIP
jgi:hypothetical protein